MRRKDDKPPEDHWKKRFPELEKELLDTYYQFKGWNHEGIPTRESHFGKVWQGDTASHVFKLKNAGQAELKIENMEILGPYTTVMLKRRVAAGPTLEITVAQDTDKVVGEVKTGAVLHTNDLAHPTIELKMSGHVRPILAVQPCAPCS